MPPTPKPRPPGAAKPPGLRAWSLEPGPPPAPRLKQAPGPPSCWAPLPPPPALPTPVPTTAPTAEGSAAAKGSTPVPEPFPGKSSSIFVLTPALPSPQKKRKARKRRSRKTGGPSDGGSKDVEGVEEADEDEDAGGSHGVPESLEAEGGWEVVGRR